MAKFTAQFIPYKETKAFSSIAIDYLANSPALTELYAHAPNLEGVRQAIGERKHFPTDRAGLVQYLEQQYNAVSIATKVQANIERLLLENTFTITTAHQPNIFTGHLYFIYKILHTIRLAEELGKELPENNFVPVYYMGSEDADLEELGEVTINGKKYVWETNQAGAVGRMKIDKAFIALIDAIDAQLSVEPYGTEIISMVRKAYSPGRSIEDATFELVHELFSEYGLVILLPDNAALKRSFAPILEKELKEQFSYKAVAETMEQFPSEYKVQAAGREINLFYLEEDSRERIEAVNGQWSIVNKDLRFDQNTILEEVKKNPERFSPNVILRPVFQEWILPNIVFIGGAGELAYWLELKKVFEVAEVPYPVLVLRNSFLVVAPRIQEKIHALKLEPIDFFQSTAQMVEDIVTKGSSLRLDLADEKNQLNSLYNKVQAVAGAIDPTLSKHVLALHAGAKKKVEQLERKMMNAEKKKFEAQQRQVEKIKALLFPNNSLQERVDNVLPFYAVYGKEFINMLYQHSLGLQQEFCILTPSGA
jgi:bacillithiol biosynthesis cysteine-adding enzyme BshC